MINLKVKKLVNKTDDTQVYYEEIEKNKFPLLTIGKNSNFVGAGVNIRTSAEHQFKRNFPVQTHNIHIGKYVAVGADVSFIVGSNHNHHALTIKNIGSADPDYPNKGQILVQNDVFIGHGATIMGGVTIHNGAVIAANSHVVEDVPAYAIVGGNPAKVIKYRFSPDIIKKLQTIKWWDWSKEKATQNAKWLSTFQVQDFCNQFYPEALAQIRSVPLPPYAQQLLSKKTYLYFVDTRAEYPLWKRVIEAFYTYATGKGAGSVMILAADKATSEDLAKIREMTVRSLPQGENAPFLFVNGVEDERVLMSCVDFYVANRDVRTIYRSELADDYDVQILSAVDHNIFA